MVSHWQVDKHPTLNTAPDRRVTKKGGPGPAQLRIPESAVSRDFRRSVLRTGVPEFLKVLDLDFRRCALRTGVPEFLKVYVLRFPTFCSVHRSPRLPESAIV